MHHHTSLFTNHNPFTPIFPHSNPKFSPYFATKSTTLSLPSKPTNKHTNFPTLTQPQFPTSTKPTNNDFHEKLLYLESLGIDFLSLLDKYPPLISSSLTDLKSVVDHLTFIGFTPSELRRIIGMCPEVLSLSISDVVCVFSFLLREVRVPGFDLKRVINKRPRLLVSDVKTRLRPTFYFLQRIGVEELNKHTNLLSCSVEDKFMPRIEYFEKVGFSERDALCMFRRFPQLFCYSVEDNFEPKFNYFVVEMGRDLKELKEFPQYFSFSLEKRIKPRHQRCVGKGVCFPLPMLLKSSEARFRNRLEVCCNSSMPLKSSPLSNINYENDSM